MQKHMEAKSKSKELMMQTIKREVKVRIYDKETSINRRLTKLYVENERFLAVLLAGRPPLSVINSFILVGTWLWV